MAELENLTQSTTWPNCLTRPPSNINLGEKSKGASFTAHFTINSSNSCRQTYFITVTKGVPWIESISIAPSSALEVNNSVKVTISGKFPDKGDSGKADFGTELEIKATPNGGTQKVKVYGKVKAPPPPAWPSCLKVEPAEIRLGTKQKGVRYKASFRIRNSCGEMHYITSIKKKQEAAWIDRITPTAAELAPGQAVTINIEGTPRQTGRFNTSLVVTKVGPSTKEVPISIEVEEPPPRPPKLEVSPEEINLGAMGPGSSFSGQFTVKNAGEGTLEGQVSADRKVIDFLEPETFNGHTGLGPEEEIIITFRGKLPSSPGLFSTLIDVVSNGGRKHITVRTEPIPPKPKLEVSPEEISLGAKDRGEDFSGQFTVKNVGGGTLEGQVSADRTVIDFLEPETFSGHTGLGPEEEIIITFRGKLPSSPGPFSTLIDVISNGGRKHVTVRTELVPKLQVSCEQQVPCTAIDLGKAVAGTRFERELIIKNIGGGMLEGEIAASADWIVQMANRESPGSPRNFKCNPGEFVVIDISGYFPLTSEPFPATITVKSNGGEQEVGVYGVVTDPVDLVSKGRMAGELFLRYLSTPGWWNNRQVGNFTAIDFLVLMFAYELQPFLTAQPRPGTGPEEKTTFENDLAHGTTHWFYAQCAVFYSSNRCGGITPNVIFNFLEILSNVVDRGLNSGDILNVNNLQSTCLNRQIG